MRYDGRMMFLSALIAASLALGFLSLPPGAAGQSQKIFRVGYLGGGSPGPETSPLLAGGLREHGYVEGQNLAIEYRLTGGSNEGFPALAAELVRLRVDVIVAHAVPAVRAAKEATKTIPIVLLNVADPVGEGLVASLGHPGGNVTGVSNQAFTKITEQGDQAVVILPDHVTWFHRAQALDLAAQNRLPTICMFEAWGQAGCLLAYGPKLSELWYRGCWRESC